MCFKLRRIAVPLLIIMTSCTVKENRDRCPCALSLVMEGLPAAPVALSLTGDGFTWREKLFRDTSLVVQVPKNGVWLYALTGDATPGADGVIRIPLGFDCPPLWVYGRLVDTSGEYARVEPCLHKHYCRLGITLSSPPGWGEPYWCEIRGGVSGLSLDGAPQEGEFSCRLDGGGSICLPRQPREAPLWMDIVMPDRVVRTFSLSALLQEAGYDWGAPDLDDIGLELSLSVSQIIISTSTWRREFPLEVII